MLVIYYVAIVTGTLSLRATLESAFANSYSYYCSKGKRKRGFLYLGLFLLDILKLL